MEVQAKGKNVRIAPRKVRLILDTLKGRRVDEAVAILRNLNQPVAKPQPRPPRKSCSAVVNSSSADFQWLNRVFASWWNASRFCNMVVSW